MRRLLVLASLAFVQCSSPASNDGGVFIQCMNSSQCPPSLPVCHPQALICVGCVTFQQTCGPKMKCDGQTNTCVPATGDEPCTQNADCPRPGFDPTTAIACERDAGLCVQCLSNADCSGQTKCSNHQCVLPGADGGAGDGGGSDGSVSDSGASDAGAGTD